MSFRGFRGAVPFAGGFGSAYGYGYDGSLLYRLGHIPVPPYFALHPPVYYSQPIPYPYGASPFARRPARAPEYAAAVKPAVMINPYYKKPAEKVQSNTASRVKTVQQTQFVLNPYYTRSAVELAKND